MTGADLVRVLDQMDELTMPVYVAGVGEAGQAFLATNLETGLEGVILASPVPPCAPRSVSEVPGTRLLEQARRQRRGAGWRPQPHWWDRLLDSRGG